MRYNNSNILVSPGGKQYYKAKKYPFVPPTENDIYLITSEGDRLDLIANTYYKDPSLWWVISAANSNVLYGSMFPEPGVQLRIPTDLSNVMTLFDNINQL